MIDEQFMHAITTTESYVWLINRLWLLHVEWCKQHDKETLDYSKDCTTLTKHYFTECVLAAGIALPQK